MMAGTHVLAGSLTAVAVLGSDSAAVAGMAALGSLVPDLDHPGSFLGRRLFFISYPFSALWGHRTLTHSLLGLILLTGVAALILKIMSVCSTLLLAAFATGYFTHILGDLITGTLQLLYPWSKNFGFRLMQTGGILEWVLLLLAAGMIFGTEPGRDFWLPVLPDFAEKFLRGLLE